MLILREEKKTHSFYKSLFLGILRNLGNRFAALCVNIGMKDSWAALRLLHIESRKPKLKKVLYRLICGIDGKLLPTP